MKLKATVLSLALASAATTVVVAHPPPEFPICSVGNDTQACTLPDGEEGMFLCHPHPPQPHRDHDHDHHHGGITGAFLRVVDHITGGGHHDGDHGHHHGHDGKPCHGKDGSRKLRSGGSRSSKSRSDGEGPHHHHHHGGPHHGPDGRHGGPPHGPPHGPPPFLSDTHCVPVDGPPPPPPSLFPFHHPPHAHGGPPPTCGCCGDVCPTKLDDCPCTGCDITDREGRVMEKGAGVWVSVIMPWDDTKTPIQKCVPPGSYVDADRVECVTTCPNDEDDAMMENKEIVEEIFNDEEEELEEKESRD